jgi:hypothetical protein
LGASRTSAGTVQKYVVISITVAIAGVGGTYAVVLSN